MTSSMARLMIGKLEQGDGDDPGQERGPQAQGHHEDEAEGAVDDGRDAPEDVEGEARHGRPSGSPARVDVQVEDHGQAEDEGQGRRPDAEVERADDGVQDAALLAQVDSRPWGSG